MVSICTHNPCRSRMRIGFYMKWDKGNSFKARGNVIGDELYFEAIAKYLRKIPDIESAEVYAPNFLPEKKIDFMIHLNDTAPNGYADREVLYLQNGYSEGNDRVLMRLSKNGYDGYILLSESMLEVHHANGLEGVVVPFGADTEYCRPRPPDPSLAYDVAFVGNDIKGTERTERFLMPATRFNLGLFGNWALPPKKGMERIVPYLRDRKHPSYRVALSRISKGKIPYDLLPDLYSNAKINLNFTLQDSVNWDLLTNRPFEVLACGGFLISDRYPGIEKALHGGAAFTDGNEDQIEKIEYYLERPEERARIAKLGMENVRENHSLISRSGAIHKYLGHL